MPHPARSPCQHYSEANIWWNCPFCPKSCKSKGGRIQHICQKHGNVPPPSQLSELENELPRTPRQNASSSSSIHTPEPMDSDEAVLPPAFDIASPNANQASLDSNSDPIVGDVSMDDPLVWPSSLPLNNRLESEVPSESSN